MDHKESTDVISVRSKLWSLLYERMDCACLRNQEKHLNRFLDDMCARSLPQRVHIQSAMSGISTVFEKIASVLQFLDELNLMVFCSGDFTEEQKSELQAYGVGVLEWVSPQGKAIQSCGLDDQGLERYSIAYGRNLPDVARNEKDDTKGKPHLAFENWKIMQLTTAILAGFAKTRSKQECTEFVEEIRGVLFGKALFFRGKNPVPFSGGQWASGV